MKYAVIQWCICIVCLFLTGCRKELCYNHDEHGLAVRLMVEPEWETVWERTYEHNWSQEWNPSWEYAYNDLQPKIPEGLRARIYQSGGSLKDERNLPALGGRLPMSDGVHSLLFYNNDTEYIVFDEMGVPATALATTRGVSRGGFQPLHEGERTVNQPDMLYGHYIDEYVTELRNDTVFLPITLRPLVYTYYIRYEFDEGIEYIALARGALAGMAEKVYLNDGHTGPDAATVLFECEVTEYGACATVKSFGVPNYPGDYYNRESKPEAPFTINLEVRLKNGNYKTFEADVTEQMLMQPRGGVIFVNHLVVTNKDAEGGGGFGVGVEDWGEQIDIPLPLL